MPVAPSTHRPFADRQSPQPTRQGQHHHLYSYRWQKASKAFLARNPLCGKCVKMGLTTAATVVDHKIPHRGDLTLFWSESNWQGLCKSHHDSDKQAAEKRSGAS